MAIPDNVTAILDQGEDPGLMAEDPLISDDLQWLYFKSQHCHPRPLQSFIYVSLSEILLIGIASEGGPTNVSPLDLASGLDVLPTLPAGMDQTKILPFIGRHEFCRIMKL